jgi:hypothetical protein
MRIGLTFLFILSFTSVASAGNELDALVSAASRLPSEEITICGTATGAVLWLAEWFQRNGDGRFIATTASVGDQQPLDPSKTYIWIGNVTGPFEAQARESCGELAEMAIALASNRKTSSNGISFDLDRCHSSTSIEGNLVPFTFIFPEKDHAQKCVEGKLNRIFLSD